MPAVRKKMPLWRIAATGYSKPQAGYYLYVMWRLPDCLPEATARLRFRQAQPPECPHRIFRSHRCPARSFSRPGNDLN